MSEVDVNGQMLRSFTHVSWPRHLSLHSEGHVFVADRDNHRILLLSSELQLQRVLIDTNSQVKLWWPARLCYNELTSQLYVVHSSEKRSWWSLWWSSNVISVFRLGWVVTVTHHCSLHLHWTLLIYSTLIGWQHSLSVSLSRSMLMSMNVDLSQLLTA